MLTVYFRNKLRVNALLIQKCLMLKNSLYCTIFVLLWLNFCIATADFSYSLVHIDTQLLITKD